MHKSLFAALLLAASAGAVAAETPVERGAYLALLGDCAGCHMPKGPDGVPDFAAGLSGGTIGFEMPGLGIFWPPNLTSDPSGLGGWSDEEIIAALTTGIRPDGRILAPIMPWQSYAAMTPEDQQAMVAYLRSLPPAASTAPAPASSPTEARAPYFSVVLP